MDIITFFILLLLVLGVSIILSQPFLEKPQKESLEKTRQVDLCAEYDRLLSSLQELDFDNSLGKIPAEDYEMQRKSLLQAGAEILKQLEEINGGA
jgi:hypothetical protein